jgi:hypothetical protein
MIDFSSSITSIMQAHSEVRVLVVRPLMRNQPLHYALDMHLVQVLSFYAGSVLMECGWEDLV